MSLIHWLKLICIERGLMFYHCQMGLQLGHFWAWFQHTFLKHLFVDHQIWLVDRVDWSNHCEWLGLHRDLKENLGKMIKFSMIFFIKVHKTTMYSKHSIIRPGRLITYLKTGTLKRELGVILNYLAYTNPLNWKVF